MNQTEKLIAAYQLKYLDIYLNNFYADVVSEIRSSTVPQDPQSKEYYEYLFAITHIALTESGYLNKYLNPDDYPIEVKALNSSLDELIKLDTINEYQTDIISEVLFSLQIFNIKSNEKTNVLFQKLMTIQNPDGSWGKNTLIPNAIPHNTQTAALALMRFNDKFRGPHEYCELKANTKIN
jgi:asparagine N-glycosylation enzyme membrane subunit Stt3